LEVRVHVARTVGSMSCFCAQGLGELASRRTRQLFLASVCAGLECFVQGLACQIRFRLERKLGAIMEAFAPGSTVIHSVSQKVHKVGDDRRLLCRARVAEQMLRALEASKPEDDLCQKCFREPESSSGETAATEPVQDEERAQEEEVDEEPAIASLFPKLPRGAANTSGYFLEEPAYELSFEPVNCKELEAVLELAIVRQQPVLFDQIAALRSRAVDIDRRGPNPRVPPISFGTTLQGLGCPFLQRCGAQAGRADGAREEAGEDGARALGSLAGNGAR